MSRRMVYRAVWAPSFVLLIVFLIVFPRTPAPLPIPGALVPFTTDDKVISVVYPSNWSKSQSSSQAVSTGVVFKSGGGAVRFDADADLAGSLMGDIMKGPTAAISELPGGEKLAAKMKTPLEQLHESQGAIYKKKYDEYLDSATTKSQVAGAEALVTDFTFKDGSVPMVGKRATALAGDRRLSVRCYCPREAESKIMPVMDQMIESLKMGQGE